MTGPEFAPISHEAFLADVHAVAEALDAGGWRPDHIVGVGRGGLVPGAYLSHRTGIGLLTIDYSSGIPGFADELLAKLAGVTRAGRRILLVDDINDSRGTIEAIRATIAAHGGKPDGVRVAVLIDNVRSRARVDYRARTIDRATNKHWFIFPWEAVASRETLLQEAGEVPERLA
ncbi:phosphoribosyltransferase family protein [uncultured Sphingomonas sp.]|uniref:phosphoribosyltransferase n=1 Tax=uncultured Sphingomonas sp. TaxID=158754 RepID=UPI0025FF412E|nr:phosphoribosyltransferase family protein [uncultured Sphingomonas sp.]